MRPTRLKSHAQRFTRPQQMLLSDDVVETGGPQPFSQGRGIGQYRGAGLDLGEEVGGHLIGLRV
jgi:hypothetical protein